VPEPARRSRASAAFVLGGSGAVIACSGSPSSLIGAGPSLTNHPRSSAGLGSIRYVRPPDRRGRHVDGTARPGRGRSVAWKECAGAAAAFHRSRSDGGANHAPGGRPLLVEAVAQTTHGSGASICDGTTYVRTSAKSQTDGTKPAPTDRSRYVSHQSGSKACRTPLCDSLRPEQAFRQPRSRRLLPQAKR
jgi:hypothetical protein